MKEVLTQQGTVRGYWENGMWAYRGIPFAQPPIGLLRFRPPVPVVPWNGVLDATCDGTRPWQKPAPWATDASQHVYGEDCLNLNVWTPSVDGAKRPVLVLIFGGGHFEGSNCELGVSPQKLYDDGECVMVAPNYRVGALGYLYLAHLLGDEYVGSGNLGLLDQILALQWVRDNIMYFGGDPENVTVMGQSAGGKSVASLLASPLANGLFHRAIMMSGGFQCIKDINTEIELTRNFLQAAGLTEERAHEVLTLSPELILDVQEKANEVFFKVESYGATADGVVIPKDFENEIVTSNRLCDLPILMGHTKQELYPKRRGDLAPLTDAEIYQRFRWKFGLNADHVLGEYLHALTEMGFEDAFGSIMTTYTYRQACLRTAQLCVNAGALVYLYRWDDMSNTVAYHTSDLETLFGLRDELEKESAYKRTQALIRSVWLSFIRNGISQTDSLPPWHPCQKGNLYQMALGEYCMLLEDSQMDIDERFPLQVMRL